MIASRLIVVLVTALLLAWTPSLYAGGVTVRVEEKTYPVKAGREQKPNRAPCKAAKLVGKTSYTTEAVVLENEHLRIVVLPEFGGRVTEVIHKHDGEETDLFWRNDELYNDVSWSMGGGRWSFPFWEHGRHLDETAGYAISRAEDGSITLAMDMRFEQFLTPEETKRYGRATNLRLGQFVTLRPGEARFTWTARVDNPLPVRHGFKLWFLLRQPAKEGVHVILPTAAVTGHGANGLKRWNPDQRVGATKDSMFAIGRAADFGGWYFPERDLNVMAVWDRKTAPGAKQVLYPPSQRGYIEMWCGSHEVFEECGRFLPPFGSYEMNVDIIAAKGMDRAMYASALGMMRVEKAGDDGGTFTFTPARSITDATISFDSADGRKHYGSFTKQDLTVGLPYKRFAKMNLPVRVTVTNADGDVLDQAVLPVDVSKMPEERFKRVQSIVRQRMPGGRALYAEANDLVTEHDPSLWKDARSNEKVLTTSDDPRALLDAARRLMRVRKGHAAVRAGLEKVLKVDSKNAHAHLYLAMWLLEAGEAEAAARHAARASALPGGRYLIALRAAQSGDSDRAVELLDSMDAMAIEHAFRGRSDPALDLLMPGARAGNMQPRLLKAVLLQQAQRHAEARKLLKQIIAADPSRMEAYLLLGDEAEEQIRTMTRNNPAGARAARDNVKAMREGRWRGIGRP